VHATQPSPLSTCASLLVDIAAGAQQGLYNLIQQEGKGYAVSVFLLQLLHALGTFWLPPSHAAKNAVYLRQKKRHPANYRRRRHSATPIAAIL
jgi:hypothetical protein